MEYQLGEKHYCSVRGVLRQAPIDSSASTQEIQLEPKASALLNLLLEHAGKTVSKAQILAEVWRERVVGEEVIYVAVNQLRKALGDHPKQAQWIKTISGQGYCYIGPCQPLNTHADVPHHDVLSAMGVMACTEQSLAMTLASRHFSIVFFTLSQKAPGGAECFGDPRAIVVMACSSSLFFCARTDE